DAVTPRGPELHRRLQGDTGPGGEVTVPPSEDRTAADQQPGDRVRRSPPPRGYHPRMCAGCAMCAASAATGFRSWLQTHHFGWRTPRRLPALTIRAMGAASLGSTI